MTILTIEIVADSPLSPSLVANSIADRAAPILDPAGKEKVSVRVYRIAKGDYAESEVDPADCPHPVWVHVLKQNLPDDAALQTQSEQLADAIAEICNRDRNIVYIVFENMGNYKVSYGGKLAN